MRFAERILPIDRAVADRWGRLTADAASAKSPLPVIDGLLAATAFDQNLTLVTRNTKDIAATGVRVWLQIYLQSDRSVTRDLVQRAEAAGVRALCLTVDTPVLGTRNRQARAKLDRKSVV